MKQELRKKGDLFSEIKTLIEQSKQQISVAVNSTITILYWQVGNRITTEVLKEQRAEYGKEIVSSLSKHLELEYGSGWSKRHLHHCIRFVEIYPDLDIVHTLCTQLSWSHIRLITPMEDELKRQFYIGICKIEKWSVRTFQDKIKSMLYDFERVVTGNPVTTLHYSTVRLNLTTF